MLGWTGNDKPLKLGAPMSKEEREAAKTLDLSDIILVTIPMDCFDGDVSHLAAQFTASE